MLTAAAHPIAQTAHTAAIDKNCRTTAQNYTPQCIITIPGTKHPTAIDKYIRAAFHRIRAHTAVIPNKPVSPKRHAQWHFLIADTHKGARPPSKPRTGWLCNIRYILRLLATPLVNVIQHHENPL